MQDAKEDIRSKLNIEDVIGEYVQLKRAGRNFKGLSPFTGERTPSFIVSPDKQIWHDFSSNKGGDVFSFVMLAEGLDFRQALENLARKAGVDLSMYEPKQNQGLSLRKKRASEALELSTKYYQQSLISNKHALEYVLKNRQISKDAIETFRIGYSPSTGDALINFLSKKKFTSKELIDAGLLNRFNKDLFRSRIMIPLMSPSGDVIGFTARQIEDEPNSPKYLNTPQTILYDKGRHVFGLSQAKEFIKQYDSVIIVEGNLDVVSSYQSGVKNVVASAGTAMTENHIKSLSRLTKNIKLAFDGDRAGIEATERAILLCQGLDIVLSIITMPEGFKDPDELIKNDKKLWQQVTQNTIPAIDWVLNKYEDNEDLSSSLGKRNYSAASLKLIKTLEDKVEQEHYLDVISKKINTSVTTLREKMDEGIVSQPIKKVKNTDVELEKSENIQIDNILAVALIDGSTRDLITDFDLEILDNEESKHVWQYILTQKNKPINKVPEVLQKYDTYVKILLLKAETRYATWSSQDRYYEVARLLRQLLIQHKKKQKDLLNEQLRQAEADSDDSKADSLRKELNKLIKEISSGK